MEQLSGTSPRSQVDAFAMELMGGSPEVAESVRKGVLEVLLSLRSAMRGE